MLFSKILIGDRKSADLETDLKFLQANSIIENAYVLPPINKSPLGSWGLGDFINPVTYHDTIKLR